MKSFTFKLLISVIFFDYKTINDGSLNFFLFVDSSGEEVPECLLPFEEELGSGPCLRQVLSHVCIHEQRPKFPSQWVTKNQVGLLC